jgi:hypothetical protein
VKTPKIYFHDTGLLCYLLGIHSREDLELHFAKGNIFENLVVSEMYKNSINNTTKSKIYFWRDKSKKCYSFGNFSRNIC